MGCPVEAVLRAGGSTGIADIGWPAALYVVMMGAWLRTQPDWIVNAGIASTGWFAAAWMGALFPRDIPDACAGLVAAVLIVIGASNIQTVSATWHETEGQPPSHRMLRALVPTIIGSMWVGAGAHVYWQRSRRIWGALRAVIFLGQVCRLAIVVLLWKLGAPPGSFPPGQMPLAPCLSYHLAVLATVAVVLSPHCRSRLSELIGCEGVILSLVSIGELSGASTAGAGGGAHARGSRSSSPAPSIADPSSDHTSDRSFCTNSHCSTTRADDDVADLPMNTAEAVHLQRSESDLRSRGGQAVTLVKAELRLSVLIL